MKRNFNSDDVFGVGYFKDGKVFVYNRPGKIILNFDADCEELEDVKELSPHNKKIPFGKRDDISLPFLKIGRHFYRMLDFEDVFTDEFREKNSDEEGRLHINNFNRFLRKYLREYRYDKYSMSDENHVSLWRRVKFVPVYNEDDEEISYSLEMHDYEELGFVGKYLLPEMF